MVVPTRSQPALPADLEISPRSRKFYDGTYKWDSDGFTDERGVYCEFDCYNPAARAPTPLPPMFSDDDEDGYHMEIATKDPVQFSRAHGPSACTGMAAIQQSTALPDLEHNALESPSRRSSNGVYAFSTSSPVKTTPSITPQRSEISNSHEDNISFMNRLENILTSSKQEGADPGIQDNAKMLRVTHSETEQTNNIKMALTPPESPTKSTPKVQISSPASAISTLPWILSNSSDLDKDMGIKIKGASMASRSIPSKSALHSRWKSTTARSMAQRIQEGAKKNPMGKSNLPKRKDSSVEDFTLLELHSGAFMRKGGWRGSARQARSENN